MRTRRQRFRIFDTYNRTAASQRVADIVEALRATPDAVLVAAGDAALAGLLALAIETERRAVLDVGDFDTASDAAFVERLYMPGLRRAGDLVYRLCAGGRSRRDPQRRSSLQPRRLAA